MTFQVAKDGQDAEVPIFDTTTSTPQDALPSNKPFYAQDAEFETVNAVEKIKYKHLSMRDWGQEVHKTSDWIIVGTWCKECEYRSEQHHCHYYQIEDLAL